MHPRKAFDPKLATLACAAVAAASALALPLATPTPAQAADLPADSTVVLSGTPDLVHLLAAPANLSGLGEPQGVDRSGTKVVFESTSDGLAADDDDDADNVYVKDLLTGAVELASRRTGVSGEPNHAQCGNSVISADGTSVAFVCNTALDPADTNGRVDVYVRDLVNHTTKLASVADDGSLGTGNASKPVISGDGRFVAFVDDSPNFTPGGGTAGRVYRHDMATGHTVLVSRPTSPTIPLTGFTSFDPSISANGNRITFDTIASFDPVADTNGSFDVYMRDVGAATTTLISRQATSSGFAVGNGGSQRALISGDGNKVVFFSGATNLDPTGRDTDNTGNLYRRTISTGAMELIGLRADGSKIDNVFASAISDDGSAVAIVDRNNDAFVIDPVAHLVSVPDGPGGTSFGRVDTAGISGDGNVVVMGVRKGVTNDATPDVDTVVVRDRALARTRLVSRPAGNAPFVNQGGDAVDGSVSDDGRFVAFLSTSPGLGVPIGQAGVFVRDTVTGAVTLVSREDGRAGAPLPIVSSDPFVNPKISGDGRHVVFQAFLNGVDHIYMRDIDAGSTVIADRVDGTNDLGSGGDDFTISDDGSRVAFITSKRLSAADTDNFNDVYVRDLRSNRTILVDRAPGPDGAKADSVTEPAAISGDGHSVVFTSGAKNLLPREDDDSFDDVYVRNIDTNTTTLASVTGLDTKGDSDSVGSDISRDGSRVLLYSFATNFDPGGPAQKLYVRDLTDLTLTLADRANGPSGAPADGFFGDRIGGQPHLSADGGHVVFAATPSRSIAPGGPVGMLEYYERDLASGVTRLISRATGPDGPPSPVFSSGFLFSGQGSAELTADGSCVTFGGGGHLLSTPTSNDRANVYMRVVTPSCRPPQPPPGPGPGDAAQAPAVLSHLAVKPSRFHVARGRKGGARILFRLSKPSRVSLTFHRLLRGHRKGRHCSTKSRRGRRCTTARRAGQITISRGRPGSNRIRFRGRLRHRALAPGRYRLTATPLHGKSRTARFVVLK